MALHPAYRVSVYVPPDRLEAVLEAALRQAPLQFGPYEHVAHWTGPGIEQFRPLSQAAPAVGAVGEVSRIETVLLEFAIPRDDDLLDRVVGEVVQTHPWEEPVVFVDETFVTASHLDQAAGEPEPHGSR